MSTTTETKSAKDAVTCEHCEKPVSRKSLARHIQRKHSDVSEVVEQSEPEDLVTGLNLASGETFTGRKIELTAQDFRRGSWDYWMIETETGDKVIVQVERAA